MKIEPDQLVGTWRHSHEEDTATEAVYRRGDFLFPPARGRIGYEFRTDYTCTYIGISPRDGAAREECTWRLGKGAQDQIVLSFPSGEQRVLQIVSVAKDRLVIKKA
jgi:hypothetical protein